MSHKEHIKIVKDLDTRLYDANRRLWQAQHLVEDNVEEVLNKQGGVIGYRLELNRSQTRKLWNLLCGQDAESLAEPA